MNGCFVISFILSLVDERIYLGELLRFWSCADVIGEL